MSVNNTLDNSTMQTMAIAQNQLVRTTGKQAFTTSLVIAENVPVERKVDGVLTEKPREHKDVLVLIRKYQSDFEEFGRVTFETAPFVTAGGMQNREVAILNEDQATLLMTMFSNTALVRKFKVNLIKAFRKALNHIADNFKEPERTDLIQTKRASHWDMTGALKEAREEVGKNTDSKHYMCENKLCNSCITGKYAKLDESELSNEEMDLLKKVRIRNAAFIMAGLDYQERKVKLHEYANRLKGIKLVRFAIKQRTKLIA